MPLGASCGNEVADPQKCPVCQAGRATKKKTAVVAQPAMCSGCGNVVDDPHDCPICKAGRGAKRKNAARKKGVRLCPRCEDTLEEQDWDGVPVLSCPNCRGSFFPLGGLEQVLNKLREACSPVDAHTLREEFKDRFHRKLPEAIRYKDCPMCGTVMMRKSYCSVSGVIVDLCGDDGTWVDEANFGALTDFVVRGGDELTERAKNRKTSFGTKSSGNSSLIDRLLGK